MACSISGNGLLLMFSLTVVGAGEDIIQSGLGRALGETIDDDDNWPESTIRNRMGIDKNVGTIALARQEGTVRLWCGFTTRSMAVGYASTQHPTPKVRP